MPRCSLRAVAVASSRLCLTRRSRHWQARSTRRFCVKGPGSILALLNIGMNHAPKQVVVPVSRSQRKSLGMGALRLRAGERACSVQVLTNACALRLSSSSPATGVMSRVYPRRLWIAPACRNGHPPASTLGQPSRLLHRGKALAAVPPPGSSCGTRPAQCTWSATPNCGQPEPLQGRLLRASACNQQRLRRANAPMPRWRCGGL